MTRKREAPGGKPAAKRRRRAVAPATQTWQREMDRLIGERLRRRRVMQGLSQGDLAQKVGVNFQQIQKYEHGATQIGAARLFRLADVLDTPISYFFRRDSGETAEGEPAARDDGIPLHTQLAERRTMELVRAFRRIRDEETSRCIVDLVRSMASGMSVKGDDNGASGRP